MKRSEINEYIRHAEARFSAAGFHLPEWAHWGAEEWKRQAARTGRIVEARLGWDLTDFGLGTFESNGLILFTVRNGTLSGSVPLPYAEKLMLSREQQVTPMHYHWSKTEDIINRGGGELVLRLQMADPETDQLTDEPFVFYRDGLEITGTPGMELRLTPGQSVTFPPYLAHSFWAEHGDCIIGEVSSVNDDETDNRFLDPIGRFPQIEEDEAPYRLLCTDYGAVSR